MAQVAVNLIPPECLSPEKAKYDSILSSGRGGSGNIRRSFISTRSEQSNNSSVTSARGRQELASERHDHEREHFTSSGRGGSGNIQPLISGLETHPLTAAILSQHNAILAQYEQWVRKVHAESNMVRSSGRGGSGNISDVRRRSRSQGPSAAPKKRFFTKKGRERGTRCCDGVMQAQDRLDGQTDKRTSHATCSSGDSSALDARHSQESRASNGVASNHSVTSDRPLSGEDAIMGPTGMRHGLLIRWGKLSSPTSPAAPPGSPWSSPTTSTYSRSVLTGSPSSGSRVCSSGSGDQEYVSFLELL